MQLHVLCNKKNKKLTTKRLLYKYNKFNRFMFCNLLNNNIYIRPCVTYTGLFVTFTGLKVTLTGVVCDAYREIE